MVGSVIWLCELVTVTVTTVLLGCVVGEQFPPPLPETVEARVSVTVMTDCVCVLVVVVELRGIVTVLVLFVLGGGSGTPQSSKLCP